MSPKEKKLHALAKRAVKEWELSTAMPASSDQTAMMKLYGANRRAQLALQMLKILDSRKPHS